MVGFGSNQELCVMGASELFELSLLMLLIFEYNLPLTGDEGNVLS